MRWKPSTSFVRVVVLIAVFSLTPLSLYMLYYRSGGPLSQKELALQKNLRFAFMTGPDIIDVAPLTPWPWVKMCAVTSAVTPDELAAVIGFPYKDYDQLYWLPHAQFWTLLFIDSEREASWGKVTPVTPVRIPRTEVADLMLPSGKKGICVSREGGRFNLARMPDTPVGASPIVVRLIEFGK
jgi:hypothetical protein